MSVGGGSPTDIIKDMLQQGIKFGTEQTDKGIDFARYYTDKAFNQANEQFQIARNDVEHGYQRQKAINAPYSKASYDSLDLYLDTLGIARPKIGSFQVGQALEKQADIINAEKNLVRKAWEITSNFPKLGGARGNFLGAPFMTPEQSYMTLQRSQQGASMMTRDMGGELIPYMPKEGQSRPAFDATQPLTGFHKAVYDAEQANPTAYIPSKLSPIDFLRYYSIKAPIAAGSGFSSTGSQISPQAAALLQKYASQVGPMLSEYDVLKASYTPHMKNVADAWNTSNFGPIEYI